MYIFSSKFYTFPVTEGNEIWHIYFQFTIPARKLTHNTKFEHFWMQKDTNFGNTIIIRHLGPENRQNPTQKDTNFRNTIIICHLGPENCQNPTQKDMNFGNTIIICHLGPENCQNPTQKDTNFGNTIIICHLGPENCQNPTQKDMNFGNTIIICHLGPENRQNQTQKDRKFEKMHSLTPAKMPTNKESIRFSRILHHNSNALINLIQH